MIRMLRIELYKTLRTHFFALSVLISMVFVIMSAVSCLSYYYSDAGIIGAIKRVEEHGFSQGIHLGTLYGTWIGGQDISLGGKLFFTLIPLLATIPCGWLLFEEVHSGYLKTIIPKCGRKKYFLSKAIATFITGGLAIVIPLIFSLVVISLFIPAIKPNVIYSHMEFSMWHGDLFSELAFSHPLLFTTVYLCIDFVFAGFFACLSITTVFLAKTRAAVVIIPFLFITVCDMARMYLFYISYIEISPIMLMHPLPLENTATAPVMVAWLTILSVFTLPFILSRGLKHEIF